MSVWTFKRGDTGAEGTGGRCARLLSELKGTARFTHPVAQTLTGGFIFSNNLFLFNVH